MAYVFDKIQSAMDEGEPKKKNIFAAEPSGFGLTDSAPMDSGSGPVAKGGETTAIKSAPQGGGATTQQAPPVSEVAQPRGAQEQRQATLEKAAQDAPLPPSLERLGAGVTAKETALGQAEEAYLEPFKQADYGLSDETIEQATLGDEDAFSKVTGLFQRGMPDIPEGFEVPDVTTAGVQDIQTPGGLQQYLRRQAGPTYTAGEAGYDVSALARSPEFQQAATNLALREAALGRMAGNLALDLPGQARDIMGESLTGAQEGARGVLGGLQSGLDQAFLDAIAEEQLGFDALSTPLRVGGESQAAAARAMSGLADRTPDEEMLDDLILSGMGIDPTQFYTVGDAPELTAGMVATPEQIAQYNRIQDLLGTGGEALTAQALPTDLTSFDTEGYQQALLEAARASLPTEGAAPTAVLPDDVAENLTTDFGIPSLEEGVTDIPYEDIPTSYTPGVPPGSFAPDISETALETGRGAIQLPLPEDGATASPEVKEFIAANTAGDQPSPALEGLSGDPGALQIPTVEGPPQDDPIPQQPLTERQELERLGFDLPPEPVPMETFGAYSSSGSPAIGPVPEEELDLGLNDLADYSPTDTSVEGADFANAYEYLKSIGAI